MMKTIPKLLLVILTILFLLNPGLIINSVNYSLNIFIVTVFPTLFPFFILSSFLINYNVIDLFGKTINKTIGKLFNISSYSSLIFILSMVSGNPSNAKYICDVLDKNLINEKEASKLLAITFFPNPMFVIGTIGIMFYNNISIGIILLISIYLTNIILGITLRNKYKEKYTSNNNLNKKILKFPNILKESIFLSIQNLLLILGNITVFVLITNIVFNYLNINPVISSILSGILEITNGLKLISILNININIKLLLSSAVLYLSGICIFCQASCILSNYKINYKFVIIYKLVGLFINIIVTLFISLILYIITMV